MARGWIAFNVQPLTAPGSHGAAVDCPELEGMTFFKSDYGAVISWLDEIFIYYTTLDLKQSKKGGKKNERRERWKWKIKKKAQAASKL